MNSLTMKKRYNLVSLFLVCIGFPAFVSVMMFPTAAAATKGDSFTLPGSLLGRAYVDIRYGFSVRAPYGTRFSYDQTIPETATQNQSPASLEESDQLRLPESKELVRFCEESGETTLTVSLMVARKRNFTIEQMQATREQHWQRFPTQADLEPNSIAAHHDLPSLSVTVHWKRSPSDTTSFLIQETILQCEPSRFFVLTLTQAIQNASQQSAAKKLNSAVVKNFEYIDKSEQDQRRRAARLRSQKCLDGLGFLSVKNTLSLPYGYRIRYQNKDIGYMQIREQLGTLDEKTVIQIHCDSFVASRSMAASFLRLRGYGKGPAPPGSSGHTPWGSIRLHEEYQVLGDFKSEKFLAICVDPNHPPTKYREQGTWKPGDITILRFDDPTDETKHFSETLKVNDKLYLPGGLTFLLHRILEPNPTEEYLFLRYANQVLRFYSLRVVGQETLRVAKPDTQESPSGTEEPVEQETTISTTYLVGRVGLDEVIVETWIDKNGHVVKLRTQDDLVLIRSTIETLEKLWPKEIQSLKKESKP